MATTRTLTIQDMQEAWRLLSIVTGKESAAKEAGSGFQSAKTGIDSEYNTAESRAKTNYDKAVTTAQTKRATKRRPAPRSCLFRNQPVMPTAPRTSGSQRQRQAAPQTPPPRPTSQAAAIGIGVSWRVSIGIVAEQPDCRNYQDQEV